MNYYLLENDQPRGPYTIGQLRSIWNSGAVTSATLHCQEGDDSWKPLGAIIHELEPPPVVTPTPPQIPQAVVFQQPAPPKRGIGAGLGCLIIAIATVVIVIAIGSSETTKSASELKGSSASEHKVLKAGLSAGRDTLTIRNEDNFDWGPTTIYLNGKPPFAYEAVIPGLKAGQRIKVRLSDFAKHNGGERFQPDRMKLVEAWIGGGDFDYVQYGL